MKKRIKTIIGVAQSSVNYLTNSVEQWIKQIEEESPPFIFKDFEYCCKAIRHDIALIEWQLGKIEVDCYYSCNKKLMKTIDQINLDLTLVKREIGNFFYGKISHTTNNWKKFSKMLQEQHIEIIKAFENLIEVCEKILGGKIND